MKKDILRAASMLSLLAALILTAATVAPAQSSRSVVVTIPFEFTVGQKTLPAGEYIVRRVARNSQASLLVQSADGRRAALVATHSVESRTSPRTARLDFHRYGERVFLARVWTPGSGVGRQLGKSKAERALERELLNAAWNDAATRIEVYRETVSLNGRVQ